MEVKFCISKNNAFHFQVAHQPIFIFREKNDYHTIETEELLPTPVVLLFLVVRNSTRGLQCTVCINLSNKYYTYSGKSAVDAVNPQSHVSKMESLLDYVTRFTHLRCTWQIDVIWLQFQYGFSDSAKFDL